MLSEHKYLTSRPENRKMEEEAMSPLDDCPESSESSESCEKQMINIINSHQQNSPLNGNSALIRPGKINYAAISEGKIVDGFEKYSHVLINLNLLLVKKFFFFSSDYFHEVLLIKIFISFKDGKLKKKNFRYTRKIQIKVKL